MISVEGLKVEFGVTPLFEDVSYVINKKDRIALVGKNGAGKSTMLKILAGLQSPTDGVVAVQRGVTIGYLPQVMILSDTRTVMAEAEMAFEHIFELQDSISRMNQELADRTDYDSESYHELISPLIANSYPLFINSPTLSIRLEKPEVIESRVAKSRSVVLRL